MVFLLLVKVSKVEVAKLNPVPILKRAVNLALAPMRRIKITARPASRANQKAGPDLCFGNRLIRLTTTDPSIPLNALLVQPNVDIVVRFPNEDGERPAKEFSLV